MAELSLYNNYVNVIYERECEPISLFAIGAVLWPSAYTVPAPQRCTSALVLSCSRTEAWFLWCVCSVFIFTGDIIIA